MSVEIACTPWARLRGLIGRPRDGTALVLAPCRSVHTFGMRASLDVVFVDRRGTVLAVHPRVPPGRVVSCREAHVAIERFQSADPLPAVGEHLALGYREEGSTDENVSGLPCPGVR